MTKATTIAICLLPILTIGVAAAQTSGLGQLPQVIEMLQKHKKLLNETVKTVEPGSTDTKETRAEREPQPNSDSPSHARDPFALTKLMLQGSANSPNFQGGRLPALRLRGLVHRNGKPVLTLIEVTGSGTYMLRLGETVTIRSEQNPLTLLVKRIHHASVELETGANQLVVVR